MTQQPIPIKLLSSTALPPRYAHLHDAGADLIADEDADIYSATTKRIRTNVAIGIPSGHVGLICPRSGLAAKHDITVLNAPGILDAGYSGSVDVLLLNLGSKTYRVSRGDRIAQLVVVLVVPCRFYDVGNATLDGVVTLSVGDTGGLRGDGGFGSSGVTTTETEKLVKPMTTEVSLRRCVVCGIVLFRRQRLYCSIKCNHRAAAARAKLAEAQAAAERAEATRPTAATQPQLTLAEQAGAGIGFPADTEQRPADTLTAPTSLQPSLLRRIGKRLSVAWHTLYFYVVTLNTD